MTTDTAKAITAAVRAVMEAKEEKPAPANPPELCTLAETMHTLRISRPTAYRMNAAGALPFVHLGRAVRVRREDVERIAAKGWRASKGG